MEAKQHVERDAERNQRARVAVQEAIRRKQLPRPTTLPCVSCGKPAAEYHHHLGYELEHQLDVQPLCHLCHWAEHRDDQVIHVLSTEQAAALARLPRRVAPRTCAQCGTT